MSCSDIKTVRKTSSAAVTSVRGRVHGFQYVASASAGSVVFKNGGSGGTSLVDVATPAGVTLTETVLFPGNGVLFDTDIYITITNVTSVTVFYTA